MISNTNFDFINGCIGKFDSACFTNETHSKFNFPNLLCQLKYMEKSGFAIAVIPYYPIHTDELEPCLYGTLNFYKKDTSFYINLKGMGKVVRKQYSPNHYKYLSKMIGYELNQNELLLIFYIHELNYVEVVQKPVNWLEHTVTLLFKFFKQNPPHYRAKNIHSIHYNWG